MIQNGNKAKSSVGVIIEAKKPTNRAEMLSREKLNVKAFQELVLYYLEFTYFDIRNYESSLRTNNPKDENKLIALYKLLSPEHLLKLPFTNDSNSLDKRFYGELLHIIGLTEIKQAPTLHKNCCRVRSPNA